MNSVLKVIAGLIILLALMMSVSAGNDNSINGKTVNVAFLKFLVI